MCIRTQKAKNQQKLPKHCYKTFILSLLNNLYSAHFHKSGDSASVMFHTDFKRSTWQKLYENNKQFFILYTNIVDAEEEIV